MARFERFHRQAAIAGFTGCQTWKYVQLRMGGRSHDDAVTVARSMDMTGRIAQMMNRHAELCPDMESMTMHQVLRYERMRHDGQSHNMALMLATRSFPGLRGTDSSFMQGTHAQDSQLDTYRYLAAQAQGVDTNGRRYISGLARFPNDPEAWVSGTSDVARLCRDRGWNCHGAVEYEAPLPTEAPAPDVKIAPEIVQYHTEACLRAFEPADITPSLLEDIRDTVTKELTGEIDLSPEPHVSDWNHEDIESIEKGETQPAD